MMQVIGLGLIAIAVMVAFVPGRASAVGPSVTIPAGPFTDQQAITVTGSGFPTHAQQPSGVLILECADPGGLSANLPQDTSTCDGSTLNPLPIPTDSTGNFSTSYTVSMLSTVGGVSPINCDASHFCVLWVGVDENSFTSNDGFSSAFEFAGSTTTTTTSGTTTTTSGTTTTTSGTSTTTSGTTTTAPPTTTTTSSTTTTTTPGSTTTSSSPRATTTSTGAGTGLTSTTGPSVASGGGSASGGTGPGSGIVNASSGSLAFTGPPRVLPWLVGLGIVLMVLGSLGRRLVPRRTP